METNYTISTEEWVGIEHYLVGENSTEEKLAFENKMSEDISLTSKVKEVRLLLAGIESASLRTQLNNYHTNLKKNHPQKGGGKIILLRRKWAVAASVTVLISLSVWMFALKDDPYEKLYAAYYKPDPGLMSAMGLGDNYLFNKAMLDYKTGKYKKAINEWNTLKTNSTHNDTLNYFLGVAQQADGNNAAAISLLQSIALDTASPFYKDACWYYGLALLQQGKVTEAIPYLEKAGRPQSSELISKLKK